MKKNLFITTFFILLVLVGSARKEVTLPSWSALSQVQIKEFIKQEKISPLAVENIDKITILLSDKGGKYHVSVNKEGEFQIWEKPLSGNNGYSLPVSLEHHVNIDPDISSIAYTTVIINDQNILKDAYKVQVNYSDNGVKNKMIKNSKAVIIPYENLNAGPNLTKIFDKKGNVIYKNPY